MKRVRKTNHSFVIRMIKYKKSGSEKYVKNGKARGNQKYLCKECGCNFIEGDRKTNEKIKARKVKCSMLYVTGKMSINKIAKIFGMCQSLVYRWTNEAAKKLPDYKGNTAQKLSSTNLISYLSLYLCNNST